MMANIVSARTPVDNVKFAGRNTVNFGHLMDVEAAGTKAYVSVGFFQGLETYDISNPFNPQRLSFGGNPNWRAKAYGDTLFTFCRENGLNIFNIENATNFIGSCPSGGSNIFFEGGAIAGNYLYVATHQNGIVKVNINNLTNPFVVSTFRLADNACWNLETYGDYLLVANGRFGLSVVNTVPNLNEAAALDLPGLANDILIDGDIVVISLGVSGIAAVDISDPLNPELLNINPTMGCAWGMGIEDHLVAVGSWRALELFDISDPQNLTLAGWENTHVWAMGADISDYQGIPLITEADWRGMAAYLYTPDSEPDIDVYPMHLDFGTVSGGADSAVMIYNTGGGILNVINIQTPNGITANPNSFSLESGDSIAVVLHSNGALINGSVHYLSSDPDEPDFNQHIYVNSTDFPRFGTTAPDFTLNGTDGQIYTLSEMTGNVVFLEFGGGW